MSQSAITEKTRKDDLFKTSGSTTTVNQIEATKDEASCGLEYFNSFNNDSVLCFQDSEKEGDKELNNAKRPINQDTVTNTVSLPNSGHGGSSSRTSENQSNQIVQDNEKPADKYLADELLVISTYGDKIIEGSPKDPEDSTNCTVPSPKESKNQVNQIVNNVADDIIVLSSDEDGNVGIQDTRFMNLIYPVTLEMMKKKKLQSISGLGASSSRESKKRVDEKIEHLVGPNLDQIDSPPKIKKK